MAGLDHDDVDQDQKKTNFSFAPHALKIRDPFFLHYLEITKKMGCSNHYAVGGEGGDDFKKNHHSIHYLVISLLRLR